MQSWAATLRNWRLDLQGLLHELIVYDRSISQSERLAIEAYLIDKYYIAIECMLHLGFCNARASLPASILRLMVPAMKLSLRRLLSCGNRSGRRGLVRRPGHIQLQG